MSEEVDVDMALKVFQRFSLEPLSRRVSNGDDSSTAPAEPYIPTCFLPQATREMGYYPTHTTLTAFLKRVSAMEGGCISFAIYLQLCEELVETRGVPPQVVHELVCSLATAGAGVVTGAELRVLLTAASPLISCGEVEAIVEMLDPSATGQIPLEALERVLVDHQRPLSEVAWRSTTPQRNSSGRRVRRVRRSTKAQGDAMSGGAGGKGRDEEGEKRRPSRQSQSRSVSRHRRSSGAAEEPHPIDSPVPQPHGNDSRAARGATRQEGAEDRAFHRTERNTTTLSSVPAPPHPSHDAAMPTTSLTPTNATPSLSTRPRATHTTQRRYRSELTDVSVVVDPTPLPSAVAPRDSSRRWRPQQLGGPPSSGDHLPQNLRRSEEDAATAEDRESPHEPFVPSAANRDEPAPLSGDGEAPAPAEASPKAEEGPEKRRQKSKNPMDRCCVVC